MQRYEMVLQQSWTCMKESQLICAATEEHTFGREKAQAISIKQKV